jgi:THO complex subunit 4
MSGKLDQSLDAIMKDRPIAAGRKNRRGAPARNAAVKSKAATTAAIAPTGGVQKKTKSAKPAKTTVVAPVPTGDSKISVSGLPEDVTEVMIKVR